MLKKLILLVIICNLQFAINICYSQVRVIDSLKNILKTAKEDTNKVKLLNDLSWEYKVVGNYSDAIQYANYSKDIAEKLCYKRGIASAYNLSGIVFYNQGNYVEALKNHLIALKIREKAGDQWGIAASYSNIGNVYYNQGNYTETLKNLFACLNIMKKMGDKQSIAGSYNNIGNVYTKQGNYTEALKNHFTSLQIAKEIDDKWMVANSYNNIGNVYDSQRKYTEALEIYFDYLKLIKEIGDKNGIETAFVNIGATYNSIKNYKEAEQYSIKALILAKEIGDLDGIKDASKNLSEIYNVTGKYKLALESYKAYITTRDSLLNEENTKKTVQTQMQYDFDKKEAATKLQQEKRDAIAAAESRKQKIVLGLVCCVLFLVLIFAIFAYRSYLQKQKSNIAIQKQKHLIEEKQKEILDSIHYAKRIQNALLPNNKYIQKSIGRLKK